MKLWDALVLLMCGLWLLALLWISAPGHDLAKALVSQQSAAWAQALGSIAAVIAVVGLARWEVDRANREARRRESDALETVSLIADGAIELGRLLLVQARARAAIGLAMGDTLAQYRAEMNQLHAALSRAIAVPGIARLNILILAEHLLGLLAGPTPNGSGEFVRLSIDAANARFAEVGRRAREMRGAVRR